MCQFVDKARYAEEVRATALVVVNDGRCAGLGPDSDDCVINMDGTLISSGSYLDKISFLQLRITGNHARPGVSTAGT